MKLSELLSTEQKIRALSYMLSHPSEQFRVRRTAAILKLSPSLVSNLSATMRKNRMIRDSKIDANNPQTRTIKILLNISSLTDALPLIRKLLSFRGIGVYGSWANGTNMEGSDLDLWVKLDRTPEIEKQARLSKLIREKLGAEAAIVYLTPEMLRELKGKDPVFYSSLRNSFLLEGEFID